LLVPLFQRPYVWNQADQWEPLWEDIRNIAEDLFHDRFRRPHFLGAIVLEQVATKTGEIQKRLVIDGQQRLTTAQIVLEAFHDLCTEFGAQNPKKALAKMTRNDDPMADSTDEIFKLWPTTVDQEGYRLVMECRTPKEVHDHLEVKPHLADRPIIRGYLYYSAVIREWIAHGTAGAEQRISSLIFALRDHMRFVVIDLGDEDDAQLIFETLNARGTPLLPTDLVKNFVFHRARVEKKELQPLYDKYWAPFDKRDDWWRRQIGRGHAQRARIDLFLQAFLTMRTREEVPVTHVYAACRDHIIKGKQSAEDFLRELRRAADLYGCFSHDVVLVPMTSLGLVEGGTGFSLDTKRHNAVLVHELVHQLTPNAYMVPGALGWFSEGLAEYMAITPYNWGYFRPDIHGNTVKAYVTARGDGGLGGRALGTNITAPKLKDFFLMPYSRFSGPSAGANYGVGLLLIHYFFHMEGGGKAYRITQFLKGLHAGQRGEASLGPLLDGGTYEKLEGEIAAAWASMGVQIRFGG